MTVYDLDKKATPGPYSVCAPTDINNRGIDVAFTRCWIDDDAGRMEKTVIHAQIGSGSGDREATAALLAHIRNNYLKALDALKYDVDPSRVQHSDECTSRSPDSPPLFIDENCNCWVADRKKLIKELETV
jgi:hypothetical protein